MKGRGVIHSSMPVVTKSGLNDTETRIPTMRHSIQTGRLAPAMLIAVLQSLLTDPNNGQVRTLPHDGEVLRFFSDFISVISSLNSG